MVKEKGAADGSLFTTFKRQIANTHLVVSDKGSRIKTSSRVSIISENPETHVIPKSKLGKFISRFIPPPTPLSPPSETLLSETFVGLDTAISPVYLNAPSGVAYDSSDNLYIAETSSHRIRMVPITSGTYFGIAMTANFIYTIAGNGTAAFSGDGGVATSASINNPRGVGVDSDGNVYIADSLNHRIRMVPRTAGTYFGQVMTERFIYTIAGDGTGAFLGEGTAATSARLNIPRGVDVDSSGNVYIADAANNRIRRVSADGTITTFAGTGTAGFLGDGGAATSARLNNPRGVAVDSGNVYIADAVNNRIRMVPASTGTNFGQSMTADFIYTVAGNEGIGYKGTEGVLATLTSLNISGFDLVSIASDSSGNVYIADAVNRRVRMIPRTTGTYFGISMIANSIYTIAGTGTDGNTGDGGAATSARLSFPNSVAVDSSGNVYITDAVNRVGFVSNNRIRRVNTTGTITHFAGSTVGTAGNSGDGGAATSALLNQPCGVAVDSSGNVYIADGGNRRVRVVNTAGTITNFAGSPVGTAGNSGDGSAATSALLNFPISVAVDSSGNVYIADATSNRIRLVNTTGTISNFAGSSVGTAGNTGDGGTATSARLSTPVAVAVDSSGNVYIADSANMRIRRVNVGGTIIAFAGTGTAGFSGDGSAATSAVLNTPRGVGVDSSGNVYITDAGNNRIRMVPASNGTNFGQSMTANFIYTIAGNPYIGYGNTQFDNILATSLRLNEPNGVRFRAGKLYIADTNNNIVRMVPTTNGTHFGNTTVANRMYTVAGNGSGGYFANEDNSSAPNTFLSSTRGVAVDSSGNVSVADSSNNLVRKVSTTGIVTTLAGDGYQPDTQNTYISVTSPIGVTVFNNRLYVVDSGKHNIYVFDKNTGVLERDYGLGISGLSDTTGKISLFSPSRVAVDSTDNIFVADTTNNRIRKLYLPLGQPITVAGGGASTDTSTGNATTKLLAGPKGVAVYRGIFYFTNANNVCRVTDNSTASSNTISNLPGSYSAPEGLAVDLAGTVYIADTNNNRIATVSTDNALSFVALPSDITLNGPKGVVVDNIGNVYIADSGNNRVLRVNTNGTVTIMGTNFNNPTDVAVDSSRNVYVADSGNNKIVKISSGFAFTPTGYYEDSYAINAVLSLEPGTTRDLRLDYTLSIPGENVVVRYFRNTVDSTSGGTQIASPNDVYPYYYYYATITGDSVTTSNTLKIVDTKIVTFAGQYYFWDNVTAFQTFAGDNGPVGDASVRFSNPRGITMAPNRDVLYISDGGNARIRAVNLTSSAITLFGVTINPGHINSIIAAGGADIAVARDGSVYENSTNVLRRWNPTTGLSTNLAGNGNNGKTGDGGLATSATIQASQAIVISPDDTFILFPQFDNTYANVRCVNLTSNQITVAGRTINANCIHTIAGSATAIGGFGTANGDGQSATASGRFRNPRGLAISPDGKVMYIADSDNNTIRAVNLSSTNVTVFKKTIAPGNIDTVVGYNINPVAGMNALRAVDIDNLGNLYLSDQGGRTLRRVDAITNDITIVSGKYSISPSANTRAPSTVVQQPNNVPASQGLWDSIRGVAFDSRNNIYCVDAGNEGANLVRKIY